MAEQKPPEDSDEDDDVRELADQLDALLRQARPAPEMPAEYRYLDEKLKLQEIDLKREHAKQDIELRKTYATWLLVILAAELVVVNVMFWVYAEQGKGWKIPDGVIQVWLGATVVQVVGVVTVVTKYLFPNRDRQSTTPEPK